MVTFTEIKKILEIANLKNLDLDLKAIPQEEIHFFLTALNQLEKLKLKLDPTWFKMEINDLKKYGFIYLALHNLFHQEIKDDDLTKLELLTTARPFKHLKDSTSKEILGNISLSYFLLGVNSLKINPTLPYLISEKIILGEFFSVGGLDNGVWGFRVKNELLPQVVENILKKTEKNTHQFLIKKYKNFVFDFI